MTPRVLAIIPARGGSKGIPKKNLAPLGGLPLIAHTIRSALACSLFDRVVVSTDSPEIAETAQAHGAEVPFMRPQALATDTSLVGPVLHHCVQEMAGQGYHPAAAALLYPSHPFRPDGLLEQCIRANLRGFGPVITAKQVAPDQFRAYGLYEGHLLSTPATQQYCIVPDNELAFMDIDTPEDLRVAEEILARGLISISPGAS